MRIAPRSAAVTCAAAIVVTLTTVVKKGKRRVNVTLGTAKIKVRAGKAATISVKLSKVGQKLLRAGLLKVTVAAKPSASGDKRIASASGTLKRVRR